MIGQILAGVDVADLPFDPIGARGGEAVGHVFSVVGDGDILERDRAVSREFVGVKENLGFLLEILGGVENRLVLQAVVSIEKVSSALFGGSADAFDVPNIGEMFLELVATGDFIEISFGDGVLGFDPLHGLFRIEIFKPAVVVGDVDAVDFLGKRLWMGVRIGQLFC